MTLSDQKFWLIGLGGCVLGAAMALSPVTIATGSVLVLLTAAACRGLTGVERRLVLYVLIVAIALRVAMIAALFAASDPHDLASFPFDGDARLLKLRALWIRNIWLGTPVDPQYFYEAFGAYGWTSYIYVVAYLQYLLSPAPYAIHLFSVCCFVAAVVLLHRLVRRSYGPVPAILALVVILFLPTVLMWSVSALKESLYLLLLTAIVVGVVNAVRGAGAVQRMGGLAAAIVAMMAVDTVRGGALVIVAAALGVALVGTFVTRRVYMLALALLLLPPVTARVLEQPAVRTSVMARLRTSAGVHIGHVHTQGHGYKLLDQRFYSGDRVESMTWSEGQRFALRALSSFVLVPLPWQVASRSELLFLPQQLMWYGLVLLAIVGVMKGCQGDVFVTWLFIGMICAGAAAIAPNEGNIGTLVRHRDTVVPFVVCLSALGAFSVWSWAGLLVASHRQPDPVGQLAASFDPRQPRVARVLQRAVDSSVVGGSLYRLSHESRAWAAVAALLRPTIGYRDDIRTAQIDAQWDEALTRIAAGGRVMSVLGRGFDVLARAWREAATARVVDRVSMLEPWQRLRLFGSVLLVGALTAGVLARFGDQAWPSVFAWAATVVYAIGLIARSRRLEVALREKHIPPPAVASPFELTT